MDYWLLIVLLLPMHALASENTTPRKVAVDLNLYPHLDPVDNDTDLTLTVNTRLPGGISYFSFQNFAGVVGGGGASFVRSEQNLRWSWAKNWPVDLNLQAVLVESGDDLWQLGLAWRVSDTRHLRPMFEQLNLTYRVTLHAQRLSADDDDAWQLEHFFRLSLPGISDRLYLSGFMDQTFDLNLPEAFPHHPIVTEVQLGVRLFRHLYAVSEYRRNEFRLAENENLAVGFEYKFRW